MNRTKLLLLALLIVTLCPIREVFSQTQLLSAENRRRIRDERLQYERSPASFLALPEAPRQRLYVDWGGWIDFNYTNFKALGRRRQLGYQDGRFWIGVNLDNTQSLYARIRTVNTNWGKGDSFNGRDDDVIEPKIDLLFYNLDIRRALATYWDVDFPMELNLRVGRQFITLGQGWFYFQRNDAVMLEGAVGPLDFMTFAARSIKSDDYWDASTLDFNKSRRFFYGGQVTYRDLKNCDPYFMWLIEKDQSGRYFNDPVVKSDYDAYYLGLGIQGSITPELEYYAEGVRQAGKSTATNTMQTVSDKERISAWAFDVGVNYYFDHPTTPRVGLEYGWASGDGDRGSVTNTIGGNTLGTVDRQFLGFGYMDTGYSFAPLFSNLQFLKYDASFRPLAQSKNRCLRNLAVGSRVYHFWKTRGQGTTSDLRDDRSSSDLGQELDFYIDWQLLSDLRLTVQYGIFFPGQSMTNSNNTDYLSVGLLFNF